MKKIPTPKRVIKIKHKRHIRTLRLGFLFLILFISIVGALSYFSFNNRVTINKVKVVGTNIINSSKVISIVKNELSGKYFGLFSRANSLIFPRKKIHDNLVHIFPRINKVLVERNNLNILQINIKERSGSYLYCGNTIPNTISKIGENCYFINNDGYIFGKAPYFSGDVYFKYYLKLGNNKVVLGQNIMDVNHFHDLVRFIDGITALGFKPVSLIINRNGLNTIYLNSNVGDLTPKILFQTDNNLNDILNNLSTAMDTDEFANEINLKYNALQYIDLRFDNKVLYKFVK